jgi:hypothetical protein
VLFASRRFQRVDLIDAGANELFDVAPLAAGDASDQLRSQFSIGRKHSAVRMTIRSLSRSGDRAARRSTPHQTIELHDLSVTSLRRMRSDSKNIA